MAYERKGILKIEDVLPHVSFGGRRSNIPSVREFHNISINMTSQRYQLFKVKGITCVNCGIEGKYFAIERTFNPSHTDFPSGIFSPQGYLS